MTDEEQIEAMAAEVVASNYTDRQAIAELKAKMMSMQPGAPLPTTRYFKLALKAFTERL
jgi:hypothetical protein